MLSDKEIKYHFSDLEDIELKNLVERNCFLNNIGKWMISNYTII